jgi:hypothetical protein
VKGKVGLDHLGIGQGQVQPSGTIPMSTLRQLAAGQYAVKFDLAERDKALFLAAGATGDAAIFTQSGAVPAHPAQVILRSARIPTSWC